MKVKAINEYGRELHNAENVILLELLPVKATLQATFIPELTFYVGDDSPSFTFDDFKVKTLDTYTLQYTSAMIDPSSTDKDLDLPEFIDFDAADR